MAVPSNTSYVTWQVPSPTTDVLHVLDAAGQLLSTINSSGSFIGVGSSSGIIFSPSISSATPATTRVVDSEPTISGTSVAISGSIAGVRGNITVNAGSTVTSGSIYGTQGKLSLPGTMSTTGFCSGVFAQLDLSLTTALSSTNVAALWADMGSTMSAAVISSGVALLDIAHLTNTCPGATINSAIHVEALATYLLDLSNSTYPAGYATSATAGTQIGRIKIKLPSGDGYIDVTSLT